jgi:UDP-glucose 4-epimerase
VPRGKRIFVTGGAGFIGTALAMRLVVDDNEVVAFGRLDRDALRHTALAGHPRFRFEPGDVLDPEGLGAALDRARPEIVVHAAAKAGVATYFEAPCTTMQVNMVGTHHVVEAVRRRPIERLVYLSSSEVYGPELFDARETAATVLGSVASPRWTYAVSKLAGEHLCLAAMRQHGVPVTTVRPFNVYGPLQIGESAMVNFVRRALAGEPLVVTRPGNQIRSWCYVDDFVAGLVAILDAPGTLGEAINLGQPSESVTIRTLAMEVVRLTGSSSPIELVDHRGGAEGEVHVRVPNVDKASRLVGFAPAIGLEEGIRRTAAWWRERIAAGAA